MRGSRVLEVVFAVAVHLRRGCSLRFLNLLHNGKKGIDAEYCVVRASSTAQCPQLSNIGCERLFDSVATHSPRRTPLYGGRAEATAAAPC